MLPLHITLRNLVFVFIALIVFTSCLTHSKQDIEIVKALNETIVSSSQRMAASTKDIIVSFEAKLRDPASTGGAKIWYPKAKKVEQLSADIYRHIESIKNNISSKHNFSSELFEKLVKYKNEILLIDPRITNEFQKSLRVFTHAIDSFDANQKASFQNYFEGGATTLKLAMLNKLQNNVRIIEERIIAFCHEQPSGPHFSPCLSNFPIVTVSSTVIPAAEKIELTVGIGSFYTNAYLEVFVYGKPVTVMSDGVAHYDFKAASKPGKYYIPVMINFTNQVGRHVTVQKEIEYNVANIQKQ